MWNEGRHQESWHCATVSPTAISKTRTAGHNHVFCALSPLPNIHFQRRRHWVILAASKRFCATWPRTPKTLVPACQLSNQPLSSSVSWSQFSEKEGIRPR